MNKFDLFSAKWTIAATLNNCLVAFKLLDLLNLSTVKDYGCRVKKRANLQGLLNSNAGIL